MIFVTAMSEVDDETKGFSLGAVDYITKPIRPPIVQARVAAHLELAVARKTLAAQNKLLRQHALGHFRPFLLAVSDQLHIDEASLDDLPAGIHRFRHMPLADEVAKLAAEAIQKGSPGE